MANALKMVFSKYQLILYSDGQGYMPFKICKETYR